MENQDYKVRCRSNNTKLDVELRLSILIENSEYQARYRIKNTTLDVELRMPR